MNPLEELIQHGQSYWLDNLTRQALRTGELARRVREQGLRGVTSNPKTFHDSVTGSREYDEQIERAVATGLAPEQIYETLMVTDVQQGCDALRPVYDSTERDDGFVSLEVSPYLAHDVTASLEEARRFWSLVDRPNLMIKIPGTRAGVSVVEQLIYEGIIVNITLLFSIERYEEFMNAYWRGLERRQGEGKPLDVRSVASFFLSRIDTLCDELIAHRSRVLPRASELAGKTAIASAKLAYQLFKNNLREERWSALTRANAKPQRLLWASTGTKNPAYSDVMYIEPLIGARTISTMPEKTIAAFADHGKVADTLEQGVEAATEVRLNLELLGIDLSCVSYQLENEGIQKFIEPYDKLLKLLSERRHQTAR
jgi:transaldolase